jgi:UDPglucose--hexose-1-phosphate uridylyltransferase
MLDFTKPHRRKNPLTGEWILVSPQRTLRPWQGKVEDTPPDNQPEYDPTCYLCPGNNRNSGQKNPTYESTFAFTNDHPAILPEVGIDEYTPNDMISAAQEEGICRVICYSPKHNRTMSQMNTSEIVGIIKTWISEFNSIGNDPNISYVQIFENKAPLMGASSQHPHCQIWSSHHLPTIVQSEQTHQIEYLVHHHAPLLVDYLRWEHDENKRIIFDGESFSVLVPYWAIWPYETMILPKKPMQSLSALTDSDISDLATTLQSLIQTYDTVFHTLFPYSMGIHQAPTDQKDHKEWQMHFHFYPPLLRSSTVKKYLVGYEMMAESQRDITPEDAAATLKKLYETK